MRPDHLAVTVLASLEGMGPVRLAAVLDTAVPVEALAQIRSGRSEAHLPSGLLAAWQAEARRLDDRVVAASLARSGISVSRPGDPEHPDALGADIDPAPVLFRRGRCFSEGEPRVAIVGTRRCTSVGRDVARDLGFGLAAAGVVVVSGLALGVDGAAHEGALRADGAPPLAFVGGGVDVVYPARHRELWDALAQSGTIASEAPPGAAPARWRFPARNRLIAAMADLVVVVESRAAGGSMLTVDQAIRRDRQVMAVPGSVRNPAAAGTNALLADGCAPVTSTDDVLLALGMSGASRQWPSSARSPTVPAHLQLVFDTIGEGPTSLDRIVAASQATTVDVLAAVGELAGRGLIVDDGGKVRRA